MERLENEIVQNLTRQIETLQAKVSSLESALATNTANYLSLNKSLDNILVEIKDLGRNIVKLGDDKASAAIQLKHSEQIDALNNWRFWLIGIALGMSSLSSLILYLYTNFHK